MKQYVEIVEALRAFSFYSVTPVSSHLALLSIIYEYRDEHGLSAIKMLHYLLLILLLANLMLMLLFTESNFQES